MKKGFDCPHCGQYHEFSMWYFAHYDEPVSFTCPKCDKTTNLLNGEMDHNDPSDDMPITDPCPDCGAQLIGQRRGGVKCHNDECSYWFCF